MDYTKFKFRAVVDWLSFEIETTSRTKGEAIYDRFSLENYVAPLDTQPGGVASRFTVVLQDVTCWQDAEVRLACIERQFPFARPATLTGMEVSFDARARTAERQELIDLAARFYQYSSFTASDNHRFGGRFKGDVRSVTSAVRTRNMIGADRVLNVGNRTGDVTQRFYFKTKNSKRPLPVRDHRARMELTLRGGALEIDSLASASDFDFMALAEYFRFRKPADGLDPVELVVATASPQIGQRVERRDRTRSKRQYSRMTSADLALNGRSSTALRRLSGQMRKQLTEAERGRILRLFERAK
jgi:hypothetical protein